MMKSQANHEQPRSIKPTEEKEIEINSKKTKHIFMLSKRHRKKQSKQEFFFPKNEKTKNKNLILKKTQCQ